MLSTGIWRGAAHLSYWRHSQGTCQLRPANKHLTPLLSLSVGGESGAASWTGSHKVCSNPQAAGKDVRRIRYEGDDTAVERVWGRRLPASCLVHA